MSEIVTVKGLAELKQRFSEISRASGTKLLRSSVAAGARIVRDAAKANAPVSAVPIRRGRGRVTPPGVLKEAALVKFIREDSNDSQVVYFVTFRQGKQAQKRDRDAFYARFVEFGHKKVPRRGKGRAHSLRDRREAASGQVLPHRFLGPAFNATKGQALDAIIATMRSQFDKVVG